MSPSMNQVVPVQVSPPRAARYGSPGRAGTRASGRRTGVRSTPPTAGAPPRRRACPTTSANPAAAASVLFGIYTRRAGANRYRSWRTASMMRLDRAQPHAVEGLPVDPGRHRALVGVNPTVGEQIQLRVEQLPIQPSSGRPRLPRSRRTSSTVSALCITHTSRLLGSASPGPLRPVDGFPVPLAGRYSGDYYEALRRRRTRDEVIPRSSLSYVTSGPRRPTHLLECPHWASLLAPKVAPAEPSSRRQRRHRFQVPFPADVNCIRWRLGFKQSSFRHITRVPRRTVPAAWPGRRFPGMLLSPSPFGIRVSHQTQEPPFKFLPAAAGDTTKRLMAHCSQTRA